jgi:hypothetical protein
MMAGSSLVLLAAAGLGLNRIREYGRESPQTFEQADQGTRLFCGERLERCGRDIGRRGDRTTVVCLPISVSATAPSAAIGWIAADRNRTACADDDACHAPRGEASAQWVCADTFVGCTGLSSGQKRVQRSRSRSISAFSWPPSISIIVPLTKCISGEASIATKFATSVTSAIRPSGIDRGASVSASS